MPEGESLWPRPYRGRNTASVEPMTAVIENHLRLREDLPEDPASKLVRTRTPFDGLTYAFTTIDPENRLCVHLFGFQVLYGQDEETLEVVQGSYWKRVGW